MGTFVPRKDYKARLEPRSQVISGAGQSADAFARYVQAMDSTTRPVLYMTYTGLSNKDFKGWFARLKTNLDAYPWQLIPQVGLSMTRDGKPEERYEHRVAAGEYDANIENLCLALKEFNAPCFIRIGYEFNGNWNGYQAEPFKQAFIRITQALRKHQLEQVATVWCFATDGKPDFEPFYPGDAYVDWWAIDLFSASHFTDPKTKAFLEKGLAANKPMMIGESTPRRVGVQDGQLSWNTWFKPYFELIHRNPHIKAFSYINWNWSGYPQWADWGDGRLETNPYVRNEFLKEMKSGLYLHGATPKQTRKKLRH